MDVDFYGNVLSELNRAKTEKTKVLEYHWKRFQAESNNDFFIHKNLKKFLETELSDYITAKITENQDVILGNDISLAKGLFVKYEIFKNIATEIISFLVEIEDFQKKLFEKKKFVVGYEYCITLGHINEDFYKNILQNTKQMEEWKTLGMIAENAEIDEEFLKNHPTLPLDTKFFTKEEKYKILENIENLSEATNGLLIKSENYQALNLLREQYKGKIKCVYIDPPYNTGSDGFAYKDNFFHSSWLSMMEDRLQLAREMMSDDGVIFVSIGEKENANLEKLMKRIF